MKKFAKLFLIFLIPLFADDGTIYLNNGRVYRNARYFYKGKYLKARFECGKKRWFLQKQVKKTVNGRIRWKSKAECFPKPPVVKTKTITNSIGMKFARIPAGEFMMGCSPGDEDCSGDEKPAHKVKITKSFYMGIHEVTQGQWKKVMGENPSWFQGDRCPEPDKNCDNYPVESISWNDVQEFIQKLNSKNDGKYRLPTEAEWEYAARGGTKTRYWWGKELGKNNANCYGCGSKWDDKSTAPVASFKANPFGLYDTAGNVYEWVEDWYDSDYYKNSPVSDPKGPSSGSPRVNRGGVWDYSGGFLRASYRDSDTPDYRYAGLGFRLLRDE